MNFLYTNTTEKFNPQATLQIHISREGKGSRHVVQVSLVDASGKASATMEKTYRSNSPAEVALDSLHGAVDQALRLKKEKIYISINSKGLVERLQAESKNRDSDEDPVLLLKQKLTQFRFFCVEEKGIIT